MQDGYIKRVTSTIPFGYELENEYDTFLKPIPEEIEALEIAEQMVVGEEVSLQAAVDWLGAETDKSISRPGLKKYVNKKYGRLGKKS